MTHMSYGFGPDLVVSYSQTKRLVSGTGTGGLVSAVCDYLEKSSRARSLRSGFVR
jgi:hypothetical protein